MCNSNFTTLYNMHFFNLSSLSCTKQLAQLIAIFFQLQRPEHLLPEGEGGRQAG
jgi:hypothetical protein